MAEPHDAAGRFTRLTGFREASYEDIRTRLEVQGDTLVSRVNGARWRIGTLHTPSLAELRTAVARTPPPAGRLVSARVAGDVRALHRDPRNAGALFQVASQFNLLEMTGPSITPEHGVTRYAWDPTQGPACAIAAGAATIYRNYFVPVDGVPGQTACRQLDMLADVEREVAAALGLGGKDGAEAGRPWSMRNGYAMPEGAMLDRIEAWLATVDEPGLDRLRARLRIGVQVDADVTDRAPGERPNALGHSVSQAFCSALPVAYTGIAQHRWQRFGSLVLEACYEATLLAAALQAACDGSGRVLLTRVGGGAFGNRDDWIDATIDRALGVARGWALEVVHVRRG